MGALRLLLGLAILTGLAACSTRRVLTIESDPPGARVWVDGTERGRTPVEIPFVHYGRLSVRLEKEGYASLAREVVVPEQWDAYPIVDLPLELTVRERRFRWRGRLTPLSGDPTEEEVQAVRRRAEAMRARALEATREGQLPPRIGR